MEIVAPAIATFVRLLLVFLTAAIAMADSVAPVSLRESRRSRWFWAFPAFWSCIAGLVLFVLTVAASAGNRDVIAGRSFPDVLEYLVIAVIFYLVFLCIALANGQDSVSAATVRWPTTG